MIWNLQQPEEITKFLYNSTKFLFVRDPIDSIISSYIKTQAKTSEWKLGEVEHSEPTDDFKIRGVIKREEADTEDFSFEKFVENITESILIDPKWKSATEMCKPCLARYDET